MLLHKILSTTLDFWFPPPPFLVYSFWQCGAMMGEEMGEKSCVQGQAVAALSSVPEFFLNSCIILAFHGKQPIRFIPKYVTGIGDVHSSLCREGEHRLHVGQSKVFAQCATTQTLTGGCRTHGSTLALDTVRVSFP